MKENEIEFDLHIDSSINQDLLNSYVLSKIQGRFNHIQDLVYKMFLTKLEVLSSESLIPSIKSGFSLGVKSVLKNIEL